MVRPLLVLAGLTSLGLAILGVFLPLLPTTPFLLLAAACFARSSARLHHWLTTNRTLGPFISDWERGGVIRPSAKRGATFLILTTGASSLLLVRAPLWAKAAMGLTFLAVLTFIWTRPSATPAPAPSAGPGEGPARG